MLTRDERSILAIGWIVLFVLATGTVFADSNQSLWEWVADLIGVHLPHVYAFFAGNAISLTKGLMQLRDTEDDGLFYRLARYVILAFVFLLVYAAFRMEKYGAEEVAITLVFSAFGYEAFVQPWVNRLLEVHGSKKH